MATVASIADRIKKGMEIRGLKQADIVKMTGIGKSSMSTYLSGQYAPKQKNIYKIAKAMNVNEEWLLGFDVPMERTNNDVGPSVASDGSFVKISEDKKTLLTNYDKLNSLGRQEAVKRVKELTYLDMYTETLAQSKIIPLISKPYYPMPASAGKGLDIQNAFAEFREVSDTSLNRRADFLVRVSGDSMEPKYHDGDTVLVISQTAVDVGDIGVFVLNGDAYIKKFGDTELISLNESYPPIQIMDTDSFYCRGKVIGKL